VENPVSSLCFFQIQLEPLRFGSEKGATYNVYSDLPFVSGNPQCQAKTGGNGYFGGAVQQVEFSLPIA
jgi:hypothetical protein